MKILRVPWTARRSNQSIPKKIDPEYSLEGLILKLQYFGHLMLLGKLNFPCSSVSSLPPVQENWIPFLGQEDPLEKEMATHSSFLAWRIPWTKEPGRLQSMALQQSDTTERLNKSTCAHTHTHKKTHTHSHTHTVLLCSTGNPTQYLIITYRGKEKEMFTAIISITVKIGNNLNSYQ